MCLTVNFWMQEWWEARYMFWSHNPLNHLCAYYSFKVSCHTWLFTRIDTLHDCLLAMSHLSADPGGTNQGSDAWSHGHFVWTCDLIHTSLSFKSEEGLLWDAFWNKFIHHKSNKHMSGTKWKRTLQLWYGICSVMWDSYITVVKQDARRWILFYLCTSCFTTVKQDVQWESIFSSERVVSVKMMVVLYFRLETCITCW